MTLLPEVQAWYAQQIKELLKTKGVVTEEKLAKLAAKAALMHDDLKNKKKKDSYRDLCSKLSSMESDCSKGTFNFEAQSFGEPEFKTFQELVVGFFFAWMNLDKLTTGSPVDFAKSLKGFKH